MPRMDDLGRRAPLATTGMRPNFSVKTSAIKLVSLKGYVCRIYTR